MSKTIRLAALVLAGYVAVSYLIARLLNLKGTSFWYLFGGLVLIGLVAASAYIWMEMRRAAAEKAEAEPAAETPASDALAQILREAEDRLSSSTLAKGAKFSGLPVIFLVGPEGSTKTTILTRSGLDPELLAGHVFQDNNVVPTRVLNVWFAQQSVFVEPSAAVLADSSQWLRVIRKMRPGRLSSAVRKGDSSPRAAVACFDCDSFLKPGASEAASAAARDLHARLGDISKTLGIELPVYVLFTKADHLSFFHDYFHTLTSDEATQVLGATLPVAASGKGVYSEEQSVRVTGAFDQLYFSLCEHRMEFLERENDGERLPGTYEFPRELRKVRTTLVQFLVDLCRPSQLSTAPFLRGFYFCGVRPIFVREAAPARVAARRPASEPEKGATGIFRAGAEQVARAQAQTPAEISAVRKVPEWVFLKRLFAQVILADDAAIAASAVSSKTNLTRRVLLASACAICLLLSIAFTVSFINNRGLESEAQSAAAAVSSAAGSPSATAAVPSLEDLNQLEALRQSFQTIARYNREGAPLRYRWGLYIGDELYPKVRRVYFRRFAQLLFSNTQLALLNELRALPLTPAPIDPYDRPYDSLKSYLITTSNPDKSTVLYLSPVLFSRWPAANGIDAARAALAQKQFDFYADELKYSNPYSSENDAAAIDRARKYLGQFAGAKRVYQFMLAEANKKAPSLNFNQMFPGSAQTVIDNQEIPGAFTKTGWPMMQDAIKHADRYFSGEQWVLGNQATDIGDRANLDQSLRKFYNDDYIDRWREYLKKASVVGYASIPDAAKKLSITSGPQSPLLAMFCLASQNTATDPEIAKAFKPAHLVVPPTCVDQYIAPSNQEYMKALLALRVTLDQIAGATPDPNDPNVAQAVSNATAAKIVTGQMAQGFGVDPLTGVVQKLIEDPIARVEPLVKGLGAAALDKGGKELCGELRPLLSKYPFNPQSSNEATMAEVNGIFKPGEGALWKFYDANLQRLLTKQGLHYVAASGGGTTLTPSFVDFFNRAAAFSGALYSGSGDPRLTYSLRPVTSEGIQSVGLQIDGTALSYSEGSAAAKQFSWPGAQPGVRATARFGGGADITWATYQGLWSVFRFFGRAEKAPGAGATSRLEWVIRVGDQPAQLPNGKPLTVRFDLDMGNSPPVFQKGYLSSIGCVANVAR